MFVPPKIPPDSVKTAALLARFPAEAGDWLVWFIAGSKHRTDLLSSFPLAAAMLASGLLPPAVQTQAIHQIDSGARLKSVAAALGLPWWSRRLRPEDCAPWLLVRIGLVAADTEFGRWIVNFILLDAAALGRCLPMVLDARELGSNAFAAWLAAQQALLQRVPLSRMGLLLLAAYVCASESPDLQARRFIRRPWTRHFSLSASVREARLWLLRILLEVGRTGPAPDSPWLRPGVQFGLTITPLRSVDSILAEAGAMRHCLDTYVADVVLRHRLLYSVRDGSKRLASAAVRCDAGRIVHVELAGYANTTPSTEACAALWRWFGETVAIAPSAAADHFDTAGWSALMEPVWARLGRRVPAPEGNIGLWLIAFVQALNELDDPVYD